MAYEIILASDAVVDIEALNAADRATVRETRKSQSQSQNERGPLAAVKDDLSRYLREAEKGQIVITRHGKPAGVLIGFKSEEDWFDYRLENDPRSLDRVAKARESLRAGRGIRLEDIKS
jgi:prevent-host-death family protein